MFGITFVILLLQGYRYKVCLLALLQPLWRSVASIVGTQAGDAGSRCLVKLCAVERLTKHFWLYSQSGGRDQHHPKILPTFLSQRIAYFLARMNNHFSGAFCVYLSWSLPVQEGAWIAPWASSDCREEPAPCQSADPPTHNVAARLKNSFAVVFCTTCGWLMVHRLPLS